MGLSSLIVVLNSLRLTRLGRSGLAQVGHGRTPSTARRGLVVSVAFPVVLFAGLIRDQRGVSPARGQSLLPTLPSITTIAVPRGGSVEIYLDPGGVGVNRLHLIFSGRPGRTGRGQARASPPASTVGRPGLPATAGERGHFTDFVVLTPGRWAFHVTGRFGGAAMSFTVEPLVP